MAHILILSLVFPPDNVSTAHLMGELAEDLSGLGHEVTVLTTIPHFNRDAVAEAQQPIFRLWGRLLRKSSYHGVTVYHASIPKKTASKLKRVGGWLIFHAISTVAGFLLPRRVDVVIGPSPPLTIGVGAWLLGLRHRVPFIYNVQELYPDIAVDMGLIRSGVLIALLRRLERFVYAKSARVTALTSHVHRQLLDRGVPPDKAVLIPNWVDTEEIRPLARSNPFADEHELASSFVVSYAGNMGWAQNIDELIAAASELRDSDSIRFLLVGDGVEKHRLQQAIFDLNLPNVTMLDHQPYAQVPLIYASSDLSYVALHAGLDADALPSKVYRIMASGRAVLAVAEKTSGLALLIEDSGCGFVVEPGSPAELGRVILDASRDRDRVEAMGLAGRSYVEEHFARQLVVGQYASLIEDLVGGSER